jgi:hypothetical protein
MTEKVCCDCKKALSIEESWYITRLAGDLPEESSCRCEPCVFEMVRKRSAKEDEAEPLYINGMRISTWMRAYDIQPQEVGI